MSCCLVLLEQLTKGCNGDARWSSGIGGAALVVTLGMWSRSMFAFAFISVTVCDGSVVAYPFAFSIGSAFRAPMPGSAVMLMCLSWISRRHLVPSWFRGPKA